LRTLLILPTGSSFDRETCCSALAWQRWPDGIAAHRETAAGWSESPRTLLPLVDIGSLERQGLARMPESHHFPPIASRPVEILACPPVQLLDIAGPLDVFASANELMLRSGKTPARRS
jgi:hypothetical protein